MNNKKDAQSEQSMTIAFKIALSMPRPVKIFNTNLGQKRHTTPLQSVAQAFEF